MEQIAKSSAIFEAIEHGLAPAFLLTGMRRAVLAEARQQRAIVSICARMQPRGSAEIRYRPLLAH